MSDSTNKVKPTSIRIPDDLKKELEKLLFHSLDHSTI